MSSHELFSDLKERIHKAFGHWHHPDSAGAPLDDLYLYQRTRVTRESVRHATNQLLLDGLEKLAASRPDAAKILRMRFLQERSAQFISNRLNIAEGTVWKKQREGLDHLTEIMREEEVAARASQQTHWLDRLETATYEQLYGVGNHLDTLTEQIRANDAPWIISIEGIGGIGKTALTDRLLRHLIGLGVFGWDTFADVGWVTARQTVLNAGGGLRTVQPAALTRDALVESLLRQLMPDQPLPLSHTFEQMLAILKTRLKERPHVIVVDNLETLRDVEELLDTLRALVNPSKFVLTTRKSLAGAVQVFPFRVPQLSQADALELVRREAKRRNLPELAAADDAELRPIYATVGGNPLALRLVVGQTHLHALAVVLADLKAARGSQVEALYTYVYRRAWDNLNPSAQRVLLMMPLISERGADEDYLQGTCGLPPGELRDALDHLVTLNLVDRLGDLHHSRYTIHSLTRSFLHNQVLKWNVGEMRQPVDAVANDSQSNLPPAHPTIP